MGGNRTHCRHPRSRAVAAAIAAAALAGSMVACGGEESSSSQSEPTGSFPVKVVSAKFPTEQHLGETTLLRLGVRNTGRKALPALTVTISVGGRKGQSSSQPFTIRDPQPDLAQPDRPVWVLAAKYPKLAGSSISAGAQSANQKTFNFGPLKAGETVDAIWKLSAVKAGEFTLLYRVGAGLGGKAKAVTSGDAEAGGSFAVKISDAPQHTIVTDSGEVVEVRKRSSRRDQAK